jgi:serine protease DegQ
VPGIRANDVFLEVRRKTDTHSVPQLLSLIAELPPGSSAKVHLVRNGKAVDLDVTVGKRSKQPTGDPAAYLTATSSSLPSG